MDPATITALFGGVTGALGGAALLVKQLRSPDAEDLKKLHDRVSRAEERAENVENELEEAREETRKVREELMASEANVYKLQRALARRGIDPYAEVESVSEA